MGSIITSLFVAFARSWLGTLKMVVPLLGVELVWDREPMPLLNRLRALVFGTVYVACQAGVNLALYLPLRRLLPKVDWSPPLWVSVVVALLVFDFCYYWMHRAQHAVPLLWRFHRVHHSVEKLGAGGGYHHITQTLIETLCLSFPVALLVPPEGAAVILPLVAWQGTYLHSTTRLNLGPLGRLFHDNRTHRIHHSTLPEQFGRNFGVSTMLWDRLFGTAYFPRRDEWPPVGLADFPEPQTVGEYLFGRARSTAPTPVRQT